MNSHCEHPVVLHEDGGALEVDFPEDADHLPADLRAADLRIPAARNRDPERVAVLRQVHRDALAEGGKTGRMRRVRVDDGVNLGEPFQNHQGRGRIDARLQVALDDRAVQPDDRQHLGRHLVKEDAGRLDDDQARLRVPLADVAAGPGDEAEPGQLPVGPADAVFEFFEHGMFPIWRPARWFPVKDECTTRRGRWEALGWGAVSTRIASRPFAPRRRIRAARQRRAGREGTRSGTSNCR